MTKANRLKLAKLEFDKGNKDHPYCKEFETELNPQKETKKKK